MDVEADKKRHRHRQEFTFNNVRDFMKKGIKGDYLSHSGIEIAYWAEPMLLIVWVGVIEQEIAYMIARQLGDELLLAIEEGMTFQGFELANLDYTLPPEAEISLILNTRGI
jgi:hypothetical protein